MVFASREDAGRRLGHLLKTRGVNSDLVLGLPRGGVVVAAEVARILGLPLDVLIVRKIGHPIHREFAVGAMAESGVVVLDDRLVSSNPFIQAGLKDVIHEEAARLRDYQARFRQPGMPHIAGRSVLLVDDGLATGATTEAAVLSARRQKVRTVIVATPVTSTHALQRLRPQADEVIALLEDPDFDAVGRYYAAFPQTSDDEVLRLLKTGKGSVAGRSF